MLVCLFLKVFASCEMTGFILAPQKDPDCFQPAASLLVWLVGQESSRSVLKLWGTVSLELMIFTWPSENTRG